MPRFSGASCARRPSERLLMGVASIVLAAFALSALDQPWCAIPAGVCATFLLIGAVTGWCPTQLLASGENAAPANTWGYAEARQHIDIGPRSETTRL